MSLIQYRQLKVRLRYFQIGYLPPAVKSSTLMVVSTPWAASSVYLGLFRTDLAL
jgi:hypothetical protein